MAGPCFPFLLTSASGFLQALSYLLPAPTVSTSVENGFYILSSPQLSSHCRSYPTAHQQLGAKHTSHLAPEHSRNKPLLLMSRWWAHFLPGTNFGAFQTGTLAASSHLLFPMLGTQQELNYLVRWLLKSEQYRNYLFYENSIELPPLCLEPVQDDLYLEGQLKPCFLHTWPTAPQRQCHGAACVFLLLLYIHECFACILCTMCVPNAFGSKKRAPDPTNSYSCERPRRCWEQNSGHLEEQPVPLTSGPSLQPNVMCSYVSPSIYLHIFFESICL